MFRGQVFMESYADSYRPMITRATQRIIFLTIGAFVVQLLADVVFARPIDTQVGLTTPGGPLITYLSYQTRYLLNGALWTPFTYMFLHAGLWHLFMNMLLLYFCGPEVERIIGTRRFYRFYIFCGVVGAFGNFIPALVPVLGADRPVIGASGAVMGVLVAFAVAYPHREFFLFPFPVPIPAWALVVIIIILNILSVGTSTSVATHFGGMAAGFLYMKGAPYVRSWYNAVRRVPPSPQDEEEALKRAVNNIFRFEEEKRRRGK